MRYRFKEFEFDSANMLLTSNGEDLAIRHNEAKVLVLLLERADEVLSKDDILSHVWQNKTVSEQAVFQNISHLRGLFGNYAIKTFSKRGYQWQLETEIVTTANSSSQSTPQITPRVIPVVSSKKQNYGFYAVAASILFIMAGAMFYPGVFELDNKSSPLKIAYIPIDSQEDSQENSPVETADLSLEDTADFDFTELTHLNRAHFETSAELEYPVLAGDHPFVLTGQIRAHKQQSYLDFMLKGPFDDWQGQLTGSSKEEVIKQLQLHLKQTFIFDLLSKPQLPELKQANLSIAHQDAPNDLIILGKLITVYIDMNELEKAMVMADKLVTIAQQQNNTQQLGNALLYQSEILTAKELYDLSAQKLSLAIEHFETIDDLKRQADAWNAQSWLDHQQNDYPSIKASLLKSARLAYNAKDKTRELNALTYLSVMANKHHQENDKYFYLQQAENKMKAYKLPIYHFAKVPFHYSIFATNPSDKEPHLKQVLEYTALTPDHWVAQASREQLVQHYINQNRLSEAQALVESVSSDNAKNSYLKTILAQARKQTDEMISHAMRTFEQAQLAGGKSLSLDVALLLLSTQNAPINYDFYSQYINENATPYWRRTNELRLVALNL